MSEVRIFSKKEVDFLKTLDYLSGYEIKDLLAGFTELVVLLDPTDLEKFNKLKYLSILNLFFF